MWRQPSCVALHRDLGSLFRTFTPKFRQNHRESRTRSLAIAIDQNESVVRFDSAVYDRQPESGAFRLGGHEWLKEPLLDRIGYSAPLVGHLHHHPPTGETLGLRGELVIRELRCFESDFTTGRRCLNGVEKEVEDRAMEQIIIANDDHRCRRK